MRSSTVTGAPRLRARRKTGLLRFLSQTLAVGAVLGSSGYIALQMLDAASEPARQTVRVEAARASASSAPAAVTGLRAAAHDMAALLDPSYSLGAQPVAFGQMTALRPNFAAPAPVQTARLEAAKPTILEQAEALAAEAGNILPPRRPADLAQAVEEDERVFPLPPARPAELARIFKEPQPRGAARQATTVARAQPQQQQAGGSAPGFFERIFGGAGEDRAAGSQALAYAAPQDNAVKSFGGLGGGAPAGDDRYTAVYDISARTVYLPNGARLEAHSGLGDKMDDPRHAHVRMQGVTPPALYDLREREALFHGVRAIRLTPIDSSVHGRSGLLAHTYMLGPSGQSNGCVSFRNYDAFLQAFLRGEVKRLRVVAGRGGGGVGRFAWN